MRLISWNVNGLRACLNKGFLDFCALADADVICLQETKMRPEQADFPLEGYYRFWNSGDKAGYSGTAVFTRRQPLSVTYDFGDDVPRHEGRVITAEYDPLRDEGETFAARLDAEGNEVACFRMNDGVHGYFLYPSVLSLVRDTYRLIAHFLDGDPLPKPGERPWLTLLGTD